jgi:hypothetical protein
MNVVMTKHARVANSFATSPTRRMFSAQIAPAPALLNAPTCQFTTSTSVLRDSV